jgi:hypothetical protein
MSIHSGPAKMGGIRAFPEMVYPILFTGAEAREFLKQRLPHWLKPVLPIPKGMGFHLF